MLKPCEQLAGMAFDVLGYRTLDKLRLA